MHHQRKTDWGAWPNIQEPNEQQVRTAVKRGDSRYPQKWPAWLPVIALLIFWLAVAGLIALFANI